MITDPNTPETLLGTSAFIKAPEFKGVMTLNLVDCQRTVHEAFRNNSNFRKLVRERIKLSIKEWGVSSETLQEKLADKLLDTMLLE